MADGIPFTVIGGYLGAGKTTLLNHILQNSGERRFAILVNDFGSINIDAELIENRSEDTINLANGCICCTLAEGFIVAIRKLMARDSLPEHIIVEASGVADPYRIAQYGKHPGLRLDGVIVVVDAETIRQKSRDKYVGRTVLQQLFGADILILNKIDLLSEDEVQTVADWLHDLAPGVRLVTSFQADVPLPLLLGSQDSIAGGSDTAFIPNAQHDIQYTSCHIETRKPLNRTGFEDFLRTLTPAIIRAKGILWLDSHPGERMIYQQVGQRWRLDPGGSWGDEPPASKIVFIGVAGTFDPDVLKSSFQVAGGTGDMD